MIGLGLGMGLAGRAGGAPVAPSLPVDASRVALYDMASAVTSGGNITSLADQSGSGDANRNLTAVGTIAYVATDAAYGGKPVASFAGGARLDTGSNWSGSPRAQPVTIYVVGNMNNDAGNGRIVDGSTLRPMIVRVGGNVNYYAGSAFVSSGVSATAPFVACAVYNGGSSALYVNDFATAAATGAPGGDGIDRLCLGALSGGGGELVGRIAMVIACTGAHNGTLRAAYRAYFAAYFGL